jgi:hypothetical protein
VFSKRMCIFGIIAVLLACSSCSQDKGKDILGEYSNFNGDAIVLIESNSSIKLSSEYGRYSGKYKRDGVEIVVSSAENEIAHLYVNHDHSLYGKMFGVEVRLMKVKK